MFIHKTLKLTIYIHVYILFFNQNKSKPSSQECFGRKANISDNIVSEEKQICHKWHI